MHLCYIDESGTPEVPGVSSHFVLAGVAIPIYHWRAADRDVGRILEQHGLADAEIHTGWLLRAYREQTTVPNFDSLNAAGRRSAATRARAAYLLSLQQGGPSKVATLKRAKKSYRHTEPYLHLNRAERLRAVQDVADCIGKWGFARLFAECVDKLHFDQNKTRRSVDEQAFEQVVTRFERYLSKTSGELSLLVHDNNETIARKHTRLMRDFHRHGTFYGRLPHIVETPLYVDSSLTRMIQIADLCAYALRRYVENQETDLFQRIWPRADRASGSTVGVRHYTALGCKCEICAAH